MATQGKKPGGGMTVAEAGRMGGKLVSEKYGPEFYEKIGKKGGSSTAERYGADFFGRIGRKGGKAVSEKYGAGHFERIGRRGGQKVASLVERAKQIESGQAAPEKPEPEVRPEETIGA
jgi:general stress protein YciG